MDEASAGRSAGTGTIGDEPEVTKVTNKFS
jgi:hypothetical protein